ncbi:microtubule-associated serine/threonine-protein kinase 4 isoform X1 [Tachysurus ichikawai]
MEREQAERSGSRTSSSSDTDTDTVSEPELCCNSEETESESEHLDTHSCGALLTLHTASLEQKGKLESANDSKDEKMRNDHECDEEEAEMVTGDGRWETGLSSSAEVCNLNCYDLLDERDLAGNGAEVTDEVTHMSDLSPFSQTLFR